MRKYLFAAIALVLLSSFTPSKSELNIAKAIISRTLSSDEIDIKPEGEHYVIINQSKPVGKLYFRRLRPKAETFTYFVALDENGEIIKLQITDYPSSYGRKITQRSWVDKFTGKKPGAQNFGKDVDAISGGTLSVRALINDLKAITSEN
jgi:Na+-translocating ferredoxin:NAD+ oxidoreductase RnfG subunit